MYEVRLQQRMAHSVPYPALFGHLIPCCAILTMPTPEVSPTEITGAYTQVNRVRIATLIVNSYKISISFSKNKLLTIISGAFNARCSF